jgi:carboxypeptidase Q
MCVTPVKNTSSRSRPTPAVLLRSVLPWAARKAPYWGHLLEPYGIYVFRSGRGGADVAPLMMFGVTVGDLVTDSQRYFDYHHARTDTIETVNKRELELGAAALAALVYLVDQHGW